MSLRSLPPYLVPRSAAACDNAVALRMPAQQKPDQCQTFARATVARARSTAATARSSTVLSTLRARSLKRTVGLLQHAAMTPRTDGHAHADGITPPCPLCVTCLQDLRDPIVH